MSKYPNEIERTEAIGPRTFYRFVLIPLPMEIIVRDRTQQIFKQVKQQRDTISWRWYDFYAAQGDEPLTVCKECLVKPKHVSRVKKDRADAAAEREYYSRNSGDDDYSDY